MVRGERPIKPGDSWFSPKCIEVQPGGVNGGGRALDGLGALAGYQPQPNFECRHINRWSETVGDKFHGREGKSPDRQLRSLRVC